MVEESDDEPTIVPISALEHYDYCPRQAAMIHVEDFFESNVETVRGDLAHEAVNVAGRAAGRGGQQLWHSLPVFSERLGLRGVCDVVEFGPNGPVPIEHKSGRYRPGGPADLQVGAQALCLEEMFGTPVPRAVVFAGGDRRRHDVVVDNGLRARVRDAAEATRTLIDDARVPPPVSDARCRRCSLRDACIPDGVSAAVEADMFVSRAEGERGG